MRRGFYEPTCDGRRTDSLSESQVVILLGKADDVAAAPASIAVEQVLAGVHEKTRATIGMQRAQSHQPPAGDASGGFPILCL
jgi:hypothetical protein